MIYYGVLHRTCWELLARRWRGGSSLCGSRGEPVMMNPNQQELKQGWSAWTTLISIGKGRTLWPELRSQAWSTWAIWGLLLAAGLALGSAGGRGRIWGAVGHIPSGSESKENACNAGDPDSIPGSGRPPGGGHGYLLQYSCLKNSMDRGGWQVTVCGLTKSQTQPKDEHFHFQGMCGAGPGSSPWLSVCDDPFFPQERNWARI